MAENKELELAFNFLQYTDRNIFLTGRAGTGKTTFLKSLNTRLNKRFVVLAPTGVAALNAGGVTIHSFFQLPLHVFVPGVKFEPSKFTKQKRNLINSIDLIIIDEISMVRCDVLDAIDTILRTFRRGGARKPFGGVQLLMLGDLYQLPPISTSEELELLRPYYDSLYFFSSRALKSSDYLTISLKHIYRQTDDEFIEILNAVRDNHITKEEINRLNQSYRKDVLDNIPENHIVLCTHNLQADKINVNKINALKGKDKLYTAQIEGIFPENIYPNAEHLHLKVGAQVMFLKNDYEMEGTKKRYYNGKIGIITDLDTDFVKVKCSEDEEEILVQPYRWRNIEYTMEKASKELTIKEKGTFTQFPLKLAWAITIHKSQGLTFDKAVINSNQAFTHGQVYVALSRCRSLSGMILSEPFKYSSIILDRDVSMFTSESQKHQPDELILQKSKDDYFIQTLYSVFDFTFLTMKINALKTFASIVIYKVFPRISENISENIKAYKQDIEAVSLNFKKYFDNIYNQNTDNRTKITTLLQRSYKARDYFLEKLEIINDIVLDLLDIELDNTEDNSQLHTLVVELSVEKEIKFRLLSFLSNERFDINDYLKYRNLVIAKGTDIELSSIGNSENRTGKLTKTSGQPPKKPKEAVSKDIEDTELFELLRAWRKQQAQEDKIAPYMVLTQASLIEISNKKPRTLHELMLIRGIGKQKLQRYGESILEIVRNKINKDIK